MSPMMVMVVVGDGSDDTNRVYQPCSDTKIQSLDGFSFGIAFASRDSFYYNQSHQLSPCDGRLSLSSPNSNYKLALFRSKVDEISLLTINATDFFPKFHHSESFGEDNLHGEENILSKNQSWDHLHVGLTTMCNAWIKQQVILAGFEPDKSNWDWNWLERWMAVRPWENRFVDINLRDGVTIHENGSAEGKNGTMTKFMSASRKNISSNLHPNLITKKTSASHSDGSGSSSSRSPTLSGKPKPKISGGEPGEEVNSRPSGIGPRSYSNPKERPSQQDPQGKKQFSLPSSGRGAQMAKHPSRTITTRTHNANGQKKPIIAIKEKSKLDRRRD